MGMAYSGSTAGTTSANPPMQLVQGIGGVNSISTGAGGGRGLWLYQSSNATTDLVSANFFTDAKYLGMKAGDIVLCVSATADGSTALLVAGVLGTVSTSGAALSTGSMITSTFS